MRYWPIRSEYRPLSSLVNFLPIKGVVLMFKLGKPLNPFKSTVLVVTLALILVYVPSIYTVIGFIGIVAPESIININEKLMGLIK